MRNGATRARPPARLRPVAALAAVLAQLLIPHAAALAAPVICFQMYDPPPVNAGETIVLDTIDVCLMQGRWVIESGGVVTIGSATQPVLFVNGSNVPDGSITFDASILNRGRIDNSAGSTFANTVSLTNAGLFDNAGQFTVTGFNGFVDNADTFANSGTLAIDAAFDGTRVSFSNRGLLTSTGTITNAATVLNHAGATLQLVGSAAILNNTFVLDNRGTLTIDAGSVFESTGYLDNRAGATLINQGRLTSAGQLGSNDGIWRNHGVMQLDNTLLNNGLFDNSGSGAELQLSGFGALYVYDRLINSALISVGDGSLYVLAGGVFASSGTVTTGADSLLLTEGLIQVSGGSFDIGGRFEVQVGGIFDSAARYTGRGELQNTGTLLFSDAQTFESGARLLNIGSTTLGGSTTIVRGAQIDNYGDLRIAAGGTVANDSGLVNWSTGSVAIAGALTSTNAINNMGSVTVTAGGSLVDASLIFNSGAFAVAGGASFTSLGYVGNTGSFSVQPGGSFVLGGTFDNAAGAVMALDGSFDFTGGTLNNAGLLVTSVPFTFGAPASGTVTLLGGSSFVADAASAVALGSTVVNPGSMTVRAMSIDGTLDNRGTFSGGPVLVSGSFVNRGSATVFGLDNAGTLTNFSTLTLAGNVVNRGSIDNMAFASVRFESAVDNQATIDNAGQLAVTGDVTNGLAGSISARSGSVTDFTRIDNAGLLRVDGGATLRVQDALLNAGQVVNFGELRIGGQMTNGVSGTPVGQTQVSNDGQLLIDAAAAVANFATFTGTGTLSNGGNFVNAGRIFDNVLRNSGTFSNIGEAKLGALFNTGFFNNDAVASATSVTNSGVIGNTGSFEARTALSNSGSFNNAFEGSVSLPQAFDNSGSFVNAGTTVAAGVATSSGVIDNSGSFTSRFSLRLAGQVSNRGQFENTGTVEMTPSVAFANTGGVIVNRGSWTQGGVLSGGEVRNLQGSWLARGAFQVASLTNTATFDVDGPVQASNVTNSGTLRSTGSLNAGTLQNSGSLQATAGSLSVTTLTNTGSVRISQVAPVTVLNLDNSGSLQIDGSQGRIEGARNRGSVELSGVTLGNWRNDDGGRVVAGQIRIDNGFSNAGVARFTGDVSGNGSYFQSQGFTAINADFALPLVEIDGGLICGTGRVRGTLVVAGGTVCPGQSPGTLTVDGRFEFDAGTIELEIAGTADGRYDQLVLNGDTSFDAGLLRIVFIDGFVPQPGDAWQLVVQSLQLGGLANLATEVSGLPAGEILTFDIGPGGVQVSVSAVPEPAQWLLWAAALSIGTAFGSRAGRRRATA